MSRYAAQTKETSLQKSESSGKRYAIQNPTEKNVSYRLYFDAPITSPKGVPSEKSGVGVRQEGDGVHSIGAGLAPKGVDTFRTEGSLLTDRTEAQGWTKEEVHEALVDEESGTVPEATTEAENIILRNVPAVAGMHPVTVVVGGSLLIGAVVVGTVTQMDE